MTISIHLQTLANAVNQIEAVVKPLPPDAWDWHPGENMWSIQDVAAHLLHAEPLFRARLSRIVAEDNPRLAAFGPDDALPEDHRRFDKILAALLVARQETLDLIYSFAMEDWHRPAIHETQGATTLQQQIQNMINHDTVHLGQIVDIRQIYKRLYKETENAS